MGGNPTLSSADDAIAVEEEGNGDGEQALTSSEAYHVESTSRRAQSPSDSWSSSAIEIPEIMLSPNELPLKQETNDEIDISGNESSKLKQDLNEEQEQQVEMFTSSKETSNGQTHDVSHSSLPTGAETSELHEESTSELLKDVFQHNIAEPGRKALHNFFYPPRQQSQSSHNKTPVIANHKGSSTRSSTLVQSTSRMNEPPLTAISTTIDNDDRAGHHSKEKVSPLHEPPVATSSESSLPSLPPLSTTAVPTTTTMTTSTSVSNNDRTPPPRRPRPTATVSRIEEDPDVLEQDRQDREYVEKFWTVYDDIIILSLFTQFGILCRLGMASWFKIFDGVFHNDSALFTNLPLNCFSCFVMGLLCSGESLMQIISTRFTPPRLQYDLHREAAMNDRHHDSQSPSLSFPSDDNEDDPTLDDDNFERIPIAEHGSGGRRPRWRFRRSQRERCSTSPLHRRRLTPQVRSRRHDRRRAKPSTPTFRATSWQAKQDERNLQEELREVQLLALERRIRMSPCLVLFPVKKENVDVVENYFNDGYQRRRDSQDEEEFSPYSFDRSRSFSNGDRSHSDDESSSMMYVESTAFSFDNHDLALEEEVCPPGQDDYLPKQDQPLPVLDDETLSAEDEPLDEDGFQDEPVANNDSKPGTPRKANSSMKAVKIAPTNKTRELTSLPSPDYSADSSGMMGRSYALQRPHLRARQYGQVDGGNVIDYGTQDHPDLDQIITNVATDVSRKISRIRRVSLADGWDVGTTPEEKSDDLILGLRDGLCGALSSFSSWISSMVNLLRGGNIGQAFVGLVLGIQLPIVAYRFGQHVAVYIFVWRCRRETKRDIRRGYGIRLNTDDEDLGGGGLVGSTSVNSFDSGDESASRRRAKARTVQEEDSETPSVRAIITALFIMALVAQMTALNFYYEPEDRLVSLSLLFSPLGVLMRWRLAKLNSWRPSFPIGTFACNIGACALSGSLGSLLAGNPGPRERITLVAIIAGFGGTLSSVARFIVEIIAGMDPILFRMDGFYYAVASVFWGLLVSFLFTASVDWADSVE